MSREWAPGEVAMVTWPGNLDGPFAAVRGEGEWHMLDAVPVGKKDDPFLTDPWLADLEATFGPLVVIDPENPEQVERLVLAYMSQGSVELDNERPMTVRELRMQAALREFATPTPRIEEPQGLGAVVEDAAGAHFIRTNPSGTHAWVPVDAGARALRLPYRDYRSINAVRVLSEGVTS